MKKNVRVALAVLGLVVAGAVAWRLQNPPAASLAAGGPSPAGAASGAAPADAAAVVEIGKVEVMRLEDDAQAVGSLRARQGVMLRPEVSGRVARLGFTDGRPVRRGQLLVQLDDALQQAQLQQAQAQESIARTTLQRNRELVAQNFVSQSAADQSAAALEVAQAQVALAQAQLARMKIVAPFDGVAGIRSVSVGDYVKDGADLISVEDLSQMWVDFRLPERYMARLKTGEAVEVTLDSLPGRSFKGRVAALDALLDANGRSLLVRASLDNRAGVLKSGQFARVRLVLAVTDKALVVPEEALVPQGGKQFLFKVVDGPDGQRSRRLEARIGLRMPGKVEILQGLSAGDRVVTAGQARLLRADAVPLRVVDIGPAGQVARPPASAPSAARGNAAAPA